MHVSTFFTFTFLLVITGMFSGCCSVPTGCGSCGIAASNSACCPGLLHGELAGRIHVALTGGCCSGCGEIYYDEQINEPPTCDPCSGNGEFTGANCGPCRPLFQRLRDLWCAPCYSACGGCDSCDTDVYATDGGSGYCPNCRDGVAGNPVNHARQHVDHAPTHSISNADMSIKANEGANTPSKSTPTPKLEPVPDPVSDAPSKPAPQKVEGQKTSQTKPSRPLQVPAIQARQTQSRLMK